MLVTVRSMLQDNAKSLTRYMMYA